MPEFFLELFSEEIPARMQRDAGERLGHLVATALQPLNPQHPKYFFGPRRLAVKTEVGTFVPENKISERGPRVTAPEQALAGFLRKHSATRDQLVQEGEFWVLNMTIPAMPVHELVLNNLPTALNWFVWPKSMRWGQSGDFTWVRPLRRIVCLLDGEVIPIKLGPVTAGNQTEGHRVLGRGPIAVSSAVVWEEKLREHCVIVSQDERRQKIVEGLAEKAAALGLSLVQDEALLDEVTGLVEWPVPMLGKIDEIYMDLPPEVRELSMKVNQKYFALRDATGSPAGHFAFVANLLAEDSGSAIIAGNERVLRARLADARHFWNQDIKKPLNQYLPNLEKIIFHARIGTQRQRAEEIADSAYAIAMVLQPDADPTLAMTTAQTARWAGLLCKADLATGMVTEFPELQGVMGGYYAENEPDGWDGPDVGRAIKTHYQPKGPKDEVPEGVVPISVALADKLYTLTRFFEIDEKPTGSGDPYALRRAALGVVRIIRENGLRLPLKRLIGNDRVLFDFLIERLRVVLRGEGKRYDVLNAVFSAGQDDDLVRMLSKTSALTAMLNIDNGANLLIAYRRAANILRIEEDDRGRITGQPDLNLFQQNEERELFQTIQDSAPAIEVLLQTEAYPEAMMKLALMRPYIDAFFEQVKVNDSISEFRHNRLRLLALFRDTVHKIADFSKIEG